MVEISSRGKGIKCSFGEGISIVSILRREDNIIFLGGNSKLGGQGGFLDMVVVK